MSAATVAVHAADCAPCDAARAVVADLRGLFDPLDNWDHTTIDSAPAGKGERVTVTELTMRTVAGVLHRYPIPADAP